jgi:C4-dicarboxylate-specific signal transduction histidine kinase
MQTPEFPKDEVQRMAALRATGLLFTPPEDRFDRITRLASQLLGMPIALVSLVADKVQWFKSVQGLDATETSREISFCGHAILEEKTFIVENAIQDQRFLDNPLVTGDPHIRFYAGQPLHTADGSRVGTLCVIDQCPHQFTSEQQRLLQDLGVLVETEIQRGQLLDALKVQNTQLQVEIEERINAEEALREIQQDLIANEKLAALGALVAGISHEINTPVGIGITASSHLRESINAFATLFSDGSLKRSDLEGFVNSIRDLNSMIEENLQRASNLIRSFKEVAVDQSAEDNREIFFKQYVDQIVTSLSPKFRNRNIQVDTSDIDPSLKIVTTPGPIAQILSNLIENSLVHGFDNEESGLIRLSASASQEELFIVYSDNGKGIPEENLIKIFDPFFTTKRSQGGTGLGMHLVHNIVRKKFFGQIRCESSLGKGVTFHISLRLNH